MSMKTEKAKPVLPAGSTKKMAARTNFENNSKPAGEATKQTKNKSIIPTIPIIPHISTRAAASYSNLLPEQSKRVTIAPISTLLPAAGQPKQSQVSHCSLEPATELTKTPSSIFKVRNSSSNDMSKRLTMDIDRKLSQLTLGDTKSVSSTKLSTKTDTTKLGVIIVMGVSGGGKTTIAQMLADALHQNKPYMINLDPVAQTIPHNANLDIRDCEGVQDWLSNASLGPIGKIVLALNQFAEIQLPGLVNLLKKAATNGQKWCIIDTPSCIEAIKYSTMSTKLFSILGGSFPAISIYVLDVAQVAGLDGFMSKMLDINSLLKKFGLPFFLVMNKIDKKRCDFLIEELKDFNTYARTMDKIIRDKESKNNTNNSKEEFDETLTACGVSALKSEGLEQLLQLIEEFMSESKQLLKFSKAL